ncbi:MAG: YtxH domain-containing protein [Enterobacteriaceae bacterium]
MKRRKTLPPYCGYLPPGYHAPAWGNPVGTAARPPYRQANSNAHLITGVVAGAALAYLLSNAKFRQQVGQTVTGAWGAANGEVEELKERLSDLQAELEYYRNRE